MDADPYLVCELYKDYSKGLGELQDLFQEKKALAKLKGEDVASKGRELKPKISSKSDEVNAMIERLNAEASKLPNETSESTPIGDESKSIELKKVGIVNEDSEGNDHVEIMKKFNWCEFESGSKVSGEGK